MATRDRPGNGWTVVLRRQPAALSTADLQAGTRTCLRSSAATAVTIPTWITPRSHLCFSRSAGRARSRTA